MCREGDIPEKFLTITGESPLAKILSPAHRDGLLPAELEDLKKRVAPQENVTATTKVTEALENALKLLVYGASNTFDARLDAAVTRDRSDLYTALYNVFEDVDARASPPERAGTSVASTYLRTTYILLLTTLCRLGLGTASAKDHDAFKHYNAINVAVKSLGLFGEQPDDESAKDDMDTEDALQETKTKIAAPNSPARQPRPATAPILDGQRRIDQDPPFLQEVLRDGTFHPFHQLRRVLDAIGEPPDAADGPHDDNPPTDSRRERERRLRARGDP